MPILFAALGILSNCWKVLTYYCNEGKKEETGWKEFPLIPFNSKHLVLLEVFFKYIFSNI